MGWPLRSAILSGLALLALAAASLLVGVGDLASPEILLASRVPRTLALILAGAGLAVAGVIMQLVAQNRFVEPSTAGTTESATLGMLVITLVAPDAPVVVKMLAATATALAGTALFLRVLRAMPLRARLTVPLVGIMLGGVIGAASTFVAYRTDMLQFLGTWQAGDFSTVLRGRYELLWLAAILAVVAYILADRITIAGLGRDAAVNLGLDYRGVVAVAIAIVAMITAVTIASVGTVPFLGLVVPNLVALAAGDNLRRTLPLVAAAGAGLLLACDVLGRVIRTPYEIPVGTVMGVVGSGLFLVLLLRRDARHA
ncbi:iron chelate uptake ABC transporter family permease subunit [Methylobacterium terricola]|uniref:Iron chelate uptake ABC transporter family permease subunit n=1 Tax=Methylobacterium terricola TaxID=2583531 RepID=A0A5C4LC23_9HYPH|nr:iron chelate uptake ABC transporter family permease subunit [Methylobacterium terricola]TNC10022.1 iron chelate uptake ABC transporter family permease subunit [Methylobacterium terricola]